MKNDHLSSAAGRPAIPAEDQKSLRDAIAQRGILQRYYSQAAPLEKSIFGAASSFYEFFHSNGFQISRQQVSTKTVPPALDTYMGWIYAFYDNDDAPIYVGETLRTFTERFSEHSTKPWWPYWTRAKVLPCPDQAMRKLFESLLGVGGGYMANKMQPSGADNLFDDMLLALITLGNERNEPPEFPNQMILYHVEGVRQSLKEVGFT